MAKRAIAAHFASLGVHSECLWILARCTDSGGLAGSALAIDFEASGWGRRLSDRRWPLDREVEAALWEGGEEGGEATRQSAARPLEAPPACTRLVPWL